MSKIVCTHSPPRNAPPYPNNECHSCYAHNVRHKDEVFNKILNWSTLTLFIGMLSFLVYGVCLVVS